MNFYKNSSEVVVDHMFMGMACGFIVLNVAQYFASNRQVEKMVCMLATKMIRNSLLMAIGITE